jgi:hypothetical protein
LHGSPTLRPPRSCRYYDFRYLAAWDPSFLLDTAGAYSEQRELSPTLCLAYNVANDLADVVEYAEAGRDVRGGGIERRLTRLERIVAAWPAKPW